MPRLQKKTTSSASFYFAAFEAILVSGNSHPQQGRSGFRRQEVSQAGCHYVCSAASAPDFCTTSPKPVITTPTPCRAQLFQDAHVCSGAWGRRCHGTQAGPVAAASLSWDAGIHSRCSIFSAPRTDPEPHVGLTETWSCSSCGNSSICSTGGVEDGTGPTDATFQHGQLTINTHPATGPTAGAITDSQPPAEAGSLTRA